MRYLLIVASTMLLLKTGRAQTTLFAPLYTFSSIPDSLKENANAIYRLDEGNLVITSPSAYSYKVHQVVTLLNKKAAHHFKQVFFFNRQEKIEDVKITIYDALGLKHASYKKSDFSVRHYDDRMSVFTDSRMLYLETVGPSYPCTLDITYETKVSGYIGLPGWTIAGAGVAVEQSVFTVSVPAELDVRHKTTGTNLKPLVTDDKGIKTYTWKANNLKAIAAAEENTFESSERFPGIRLAPNRFEYDGYAGNMKSWKNFGEWNYALYNDGKTLTKEQTEAVTAMVAHCKTDEAKVTVLYDHLKKSMRYVSVQLGIGGFKPFPLQYVYEKQYGDCKALTNYMRNLLLAAGINAYPALVNAGAGKPVIDTTFPSQYFNHVILCVPLAKDSIWLECTSNNNIAGELGNFTENKIALLLTPKGGVLVPTPGSKSMNNVLQTKTYIKVNEDGGAEVDSKLICRGDFRSVLHEIKQQNSEDQRTIFTNYFQYKRADDFATREYADSMGYANYGLNLSYDQCYDFKTGSKYFFAQKINPLCTERVKPAERKEDYLFDFPYQKTDTTIFILPTEMTVEHLPAIHQIDNPYLRYSSSATRLPQNNSIMITSYLEIKKTVVPAKTYNALMESLTDVYKNEAQKLVVKKD